MDKNSILTELIDKLSILGRELGFSKPIIREEHGYGRETHVIMLRNGHALEMEILWYELAVILLVVRLVDGQYSEYVDYQYSDGSWGKVFLNQIYHIPPVKPQKKKKSVALKSWDDMAPFYFQSLDDGMNLIRNDSDTLINFMDRIDSSPIFPPI